MAASSFAVSVLFFVLTVLALGLFLILRHRGRYGPEVNTDWMLRSGVWMLTVLGGTTVAQGMLVWLTRPGSDAQALGQVAITALLFTCLVWAMVYIVRHGLRGDFPPRETPGTCRPSRVKYLNLWGDLPRDLDYGDLRNPLQDLRIDLDLAMYLGPRIKHQAEAQRPAIHVT